MNYTHIWEKTLDPNEKVAYEFSIGHWYRRLVFGIWTGIAIVATLVLGGLVGAVLPEAAGVGAAVGIIIGLAIFGGAYFYFGFYLPAANVYALTNKRVLVHRGWLSTEAIGIDYEKITDVVVSEPLFDRLMTSTGHLQINTAGTEKYEIVLRHVETPYELKKKIDMLKEACLAERLAQVTQSET